MNNGTLSVPHSRAAKRWAIWPRQSDMQKCYIHRVYSNDAGQLHALNPHYEINGSHKFVVTQ
jgi:hypothetical protein